LMKVEKELNMKIDEMNQFDNTKSQRNLDDRDNEYYDIRGVNSFTSIENNNHSTSLEHQRILSKGNKKLSDSTENSHFVFATSIEHQRILSKGNKKLSDSTENFHFAFENRKIESKEIKNEKPNYINGQSTFKSTENSEICNCDTSVKISFHSCHNLLSFKNLFTSSMAFILLNSYLNFSSPKIIPFLKWSFPFNPRSLISEYEKRSLNLDLLEGVELSQDSYDVSLDSIYLALAVRNYEFVLTQIMKCPKNRVNKKSSRNYRILKDEKEDSSLLLSPIFISVLFSLILKGSIDSYRDKTTVIKFLLLKIENHYEALKLLKFVGKEYSLLEPEYLNKKIRNEKMGFLLYKTAFDLSIQSDLLNTLAQKLKQFGRNDLASIVLYSEYLKTKNYDVLEKLIEIIGDYVFINEGKFISREFLSKEKC
jgi:hypothetical protein